MAAILKRIKIIKRNITETNNINNALKFGVIV